ncbi:MAG: hypothetical protein ACREXY_04765 [Gammaproteobacteria bacterium]
MKHPKSPSPTWKSFLANHITGLVAIDFFVVPTIDFKVLYVLVVLAHRRREVVYFNVTEHPTAQWAAQQIAEAFPWDTAPAYFACLGLAGLHAVREITAGAEIHLIRRRSVEGGMGILLLWAFTLEGYKA